MNSGETFVCKNCYNLSTGAYCNACGQKKFDRKDFSVHVFAKEFVDDVFDFDSKIFLTLKLLITRPGILTLEYINGRQKTYFSPVKLYLIVITLNFLVYSFYDSYSPIDIHYLVDLADVTWASRMLHEKWQLSGMAYNQFHHEINKTVFDTFSISLYFLIFLFPLVLKLYYYKNKRYYIEHLIFSLYFMSFGFLRDTLFLPLNMFNKDVANGISIATTLLYFYLSIKPVYGNTGWRRIGNAIALYATFFILFGLCIFFSILVNLM